MADSILFGLESLYEVQKEEQLAEIQAKYDKETAVRDACKIEHVISHETLVAIERFLAANKVKVAVGRLVQSRK